MKIVQETLTSPKTKACVIIAAAAFFAGRHVVSTAPIALGAGIAALGCTITASIAIGSVAACCLAGLGFLTVNTLLYDKPVTEILSEQELNNQTTALSDLLNQITDEKRQYPSNFVQAAHTVQYKTELDTLTNEVQTQLVKLQDRKSPQSKEEREKEEKAIKAKKKQYDAIKKTFQQAKKQQAALH